HLHINLALARRLVLLNCLICLASLKHPVVILLVLLSKVRREKIEIGFADDLLEGTAQCLAELLVAESEFAMGIFAENVLRQGFNQGMIQRFGMTQFLFCLSALGDVFHRALVIKQAAFGIPNRSAVFGDPDDRSVFAMDRRLKPSDDIVLLHEPNELVAAA